MRRLLVRSTAFVRAARRIAKKLPHAANALRSTLALLTEDAHDPRLRTHKLKGEFEGSWACSAGYDLRIVFEFVEHEGVEAVHLLTIGTHDEVY